MPWFNLNWRLNGKKKKKDCTGKQTSTDFLIRGSVTKHAIKIISCCSEPHNAAFFFNQDLSSMLSNNPHRFWCVINPNEIVHISITGDNNVFFSEVECAKIFNNTFLSVFTNEKILLPLYVCPR